MLFWQALGRFRPAIDVFRAGLQLKPGNEFLEKGLAQAEESLEKRRRQAAQQQAAAPAAQSDGPSDELASKLNRQASKSARDAPPSNIDAVARKPAAPKEVEVSPELAAIMAKRKAAAGGAPGHAPMRQA